VCLSPPKKLLRVLVGIYPDKHRESFEKSLKAISFRFYERLSKLGHL
jgi:hypothetical protein